MNFLTKIENGIVFRNSGETVRITAWGRNAFRVESVYFGEIPESNASLLTPEKSEIIWKIDDREASVRNGKIEARLSVASWGNDLQLSFYRNDGKLLLSEISNGGALRKRARYYRSGVGDSFYLKVSFIANEDERIYGMGQYQQEVMDLKGCNLELAHRNSQASVPFYMSTYGYGFLWNNPAIGEVHFGKNTTEWIAESTKKCDYYIVAGDTPKEIEETYTRAIGRVPMMPEYGLGFWQCKLRYYNQDEVLKIAREYKARNIPIDVIVIDYYHWKRCGDWKFDPEYFPDPKAMVDELKSMGMELMVSVWPQVDERSENFTEMLQEGLLVRSKGGVDVQMQFHGNNLFLDATNPRTREYVWKKIKENYSDLGIRVFWLDEAEPEYGTYDYDRYLYHSGSVLETGNIYPREYARLFYEGQKANGQENIVNLLRCAWVGSQKYGALVWSGDIMSSYEDFRKQICAGLHMGLAGIPWWTTDIGGFHNGNIYDPEFHELLIRWFQFGTFCPVMRIHGARQPFTSVVDKAGEEREGAGAPNEIWSYGEENERIMTKFIGIRSLMRDYIRKTMAEAHEKGEPVMRPLFYEFPLDEKNYDVTDEFMFGEDILVAPITHEGAMHRIVYLPVGARWTHAGSGKVFEGGKEYEIEAPIETLPVFLREGRESYLIGKI